MAAEIFSIQYNFFNAPKLQKILRKSINTISSTTKAQKLVQICATSWVDRHESVSVFSNLQFAVVEALTEISTWPDRETSSQALQLLSTIRQSEFCIVVLIVKKIFGYSVVLCKVMQKKSISLYEAVNVEHHIANELKYLREKAKGEFHQLSISAQEKAKTQNFILLVKTPRLTSRQNDGTLLLKQMKNILE